MIDIGTVAVFVAGWLAWTLGEYLLHRFGMHALRGRGIMSREHLNHHAVRDSVLEKWAASWTGVIIVGTLLAFATRQPAFGVGWVVGYGFYDLHHWHAHKRPPRNRYQRWLRRHHFHHHFGHPKDNMGVTWPVWDLVFRTYQRPDVIRVPRRMAMIWLADDEGQVLPAFAADYEVVGPARRPGRHDSALAERDRVDAFANRPPVLV
jgi:sterol desaturase/sphingolipid hydroxylase (fatty acid hydroxylase superfamily)